jgi:hypothetical protein
MDYFTRAAPRCGALTGGGRRVALAALAGLTVLVTACGGTSSGGTPTTAKPSSSTSGPRGSAAPSPPGETPAVGGKSATAGGALFGGNGALVAQEGNLGRKLAIVRVYYEIGQPFPGPQDQRVMASGSTLLISLGTNGASYASVAAGNYDSDISAFLSAVNQAAATYHLGAIYVSFQHEPDGPKHATLGSPAEFVRAWDHVHRLAEAAGLNWTQGGRLHWVWILTHSSFGRGMASQYWPGDGVVDVVGVDGYNSYACRVAKRGGKPRQAGNDMVTPASIFHPAIAFAHAHGGLPVFISEWGSDPAPAGAQPDFIRQMQAFVAGNREIGAVMYWDSDQGCDYSVDGSAVSIAALATMGHSAALQGRVTEPAN